MEHKLLIVDDDPDVLTSMTDLLIDEGFDVSAVTCGEDALAVLPTLDPAVIISDMKMSGMSGLELLHEIRKSNSHVQIIILTGYASIKNASEAMSNNGAFAYFQKPVIDFEFFFATIRQALEKERLIRENYHWEERLKAANARFETIFENMDAVIYVADMETYELIYANSMFKKLFERECVKEPKCWEMLQKNGKGPCPFCTNSRLVDENKKPLSPYTWEFYNPDVKRWFSIKDQAIYWHDGRVVRLETAMDITQYYKLSKEVEKAKRFKAIGVLAGGIAHDLNNALAAILGNIDLIQLMLPEENSEAEEYFKAAESGIMQAKNLSSRLLELVRGETPVKKMVDMRDLLTGFILENRFENEVELHSMDDEMEFNVEVDADQIRTVLYNITVNACEAMDFRGKVIITMKRFENQAKNGEYIVTSIQDSGRGIPHSDLEKVFDPYFTSKFPGKDRGTGLGLSIAYSIIKKHGGYIDIDSVEGKGTQVDVCLPAIHLNP